jgi:hypothetical protein
LCTDEVKTGGVTMAAVAAVHDRPRRKELGEDDDSQLSMSMFPEDAS